MDTHPDSHYQLLNTAVPRWLGMASASKRETLKQTTPRVTTAPAAQRTELHRLNAAHWEAQNSVDGALKNLLDAKAFAKPILDSALLTRFNLDLDSEAVYLRLYIPQTVPWFPIRTGGARTWTVSLLDAALHNFDYNETRDHAYEPDSTYISQPSTDGRFDTLPAIRQALPISAFTRLCRELDIGARYAQYLRTQLGMDEAVAAAVLRHKVDTSQKAQLRASLQLAWVQGDIDDDFRQLIEALVRGEQGVALDGSPLLCHDLSLMDAPLTGPLLFAPNLETSRKAQRLVAYIPDDPVHPIKQYTSPLAFKQELVRQLRDEDYQVFFSRFVDHDRRGVFFSSLSERLAKVTFHPPEPGSGLAPWRKAPTNDPKLQFVATPITNDPWLHLYEQKLNKLLNDARTLAVSTANADRTARWALWDSFVNVASAIVNAVVQVAAPFVPGLGELMLGYMAYQLLDDVFEGVIDWAEGEGREAIGHFAGVVESLVQLGAFGAGATIGVAELRKALPADIAAFIDRFKPVKLANDTTRYWKPDLKPYQQPFTASPRLGLNEQGLHMINGESMLPLDGKLYAVEKAPDSQHYRIKHPTRPDAFKPGARHNGAGAWHTELERPLQWDRLTLLDRIGHKVSGLSTADRELALNISGVQENALRKMHVNSEPVPPLLSDTLARLKIDRNLTQLISSLRSDNPTEYHSVDPQDQLQLLTSYGYWPKSKALQFFNERGQVTWTFGDPRKTTVQIHEDQLQNGDLLKTVLSALPPEEITAQFGERASDPQLSLEARTRNLSKKLADIAESNRAALFDSRYGPLQFTREPLTQQIQNAAPGLPASIADSLLRHATGADLEALDLHRTPDHLDQLARSVMEEVRINRAYEGQHLDSQHSLDTDRLVLNSLKLQPGWSDQIHLEARHLSMEGEVWCAIGPDDAPIRRTLVRTETNRYVPHDPKGPLSSETDLYTAVLHALPDTQRDALGIEIHQGAELRRRLRLHPLGRDTVRTLLNPDESDPPSIETLRLLGNVDGYPVETANAVQPPSLQQRTRELFPSFNDREVQTFIDRLQNQPGGADGRLAALNAEYRQLELDLYGWQRDTPTTHPVTSVPLHARQRTYDRQNRALIAERIQQCWRRETVIDDYYEDPDRDGRTLRLEFPILGELPSLNADFNHVSLLAITGSDGTQSVEPFLRCFPNLRHLEVRETPLGQLPADLHTLPNLNTLNLDNCNITLTPTSHARLAGMHRLRGLNLHHNPLGLVPDVASMIDLLDLDLSDTGIDRLPPGLLNLTELETAFLSDNRISELPAALFEQPAAGSNRFDLSGNPFSRATLEQVKRYFQRHGTCWEIEAPAVDVHDARRLYPSLSNDELNRVVFGLPGDIEAGKRELARLASELETLQQELAHWSLDAQPLPVEQARRKALHQLLERTWRREIPLDTHFTHVLTLPQRLTGELPVLSAKFGHIGYLNVEGNGGTFQPGAFLKSFPALDILNIQNTQMGDIPASVFDLPRLTHLGLSNCGIELSAASQSALEGMSRLQYLNLDRNAIGKSLDFRRLPNLALVSLQATGLREVPPGLLIQPRRMGVNLSHNVIQELPDATFNLPPHVTLDFNIAANPLSDTTLARIKLYCQRTGEYFNAQPSAALRERVQRLYPNLLESEADRFIFKLPGTMNDILPHLTQLEAEYQQLDTDLEQWVLDVPERHPILDIPLDDTARAQEQLQRRNFKTLLKQVWRRESAEDEENLDDELTHSLLIDTPLMGALPQLSARFEHVSRFELIGNGITTHVDGTLQCFPNLQTLALSKCSLRSLPAALFSLPKLSSLELSHCAITLTAESARSLSDLSTVEFFDMSHNPLTHAPDVTGMSQLVALHLRHSQISHVPQGVFQLTELQTLDLSHNQITQIPADILEMMPTFHDDSDLSGNPLSTQSLGYLRTYYLRTSIDFQVPEVLLDEQGEPIQPASPRPQEE
ncbi:dermonecrotic toxin domain-containing protein [Pseudomonas costantinii]|uniref:Leucine rich repeat-containing protein n=1 Tax=Pseudomonas costantinii TaxID=168469 RepID=A0A1S2V6Q7_9PSED|nr:DUF6543 domain-containing protein [Pseudomonas costantinii]NVZ19679.1 hypothetical protein [Pseudomonas costantinii]OIN54403.1 hypothetical protein BFL40_06815 [Pseudomonas costantinii]SED68757.1 Leucine rich repeat-containing protein [Pseudomonas costantinii]